MENLKFQIQLFNVIKRLRGKKFDLVEDLSEKLSLSKSPVYNRLNGQTPLTIDELFVIAKSHKISVDELFDFKPQNNPIDLAKPKKQLQSINIYSENEINTISDSLGKSKKVIQIFNQFPMEYLLHFPELFAFRLFFYNQLLWQRKMDNGFRFRYGKRKNKEDRDLKEVLKGFKKHKRSLKGKNRLEIFSERSFFELIDQILLAESIGVIGTKTAVCLLEDYKKCIKSFLKKLRGENDSKVSTKKEIYLNNFTGMPSVTFIKNKENTSSWMASAFPYFLEINDKESNMLIDKFSKRLISSSEPISNLFNVKRVSYFKKLNRYLKTAKNGLY